MHCYVCRKNKFDSEETLNGTNNYRVRCPRCGVYDIAHKLQALDKGGSFLNDEHRLALSHAIRRATDVQGRFTEALLTDENVKQVADQHPLPDPVEQADLLIDDIARRCSYGELTVQESTEVWAARIGLKGKAQLFIMQQAIASSVEQKGLSAIGIGDTAQFSLTLEGWKRARELRQQRGPGNQGFVAMWFHPDMKQAFNDGFKPALEATGHVPYRVDLAAHNNKVDDEIVAEIRRSKLVVVDATGARPNAYFEAGFAMGLGIPVLWTCNESWEAHVPSVMPRGPAASEPVVTKWSEALAFDTRQHPFTMWSEPADLRDKLTARIRALGYDAAWNRG